MLLLLKEYSAKAAAFRIPDEATPVTEEGIDFRNPSRHVYSRYTQDVSTRAEHILSEINVCALYRDPC